MFDEINHLIDYYSLISQKYSTIHGLEGGPRVQSSGTGFIKLNVQGSVVNNMPNRSGAILHAV